MYEIWNSELNKIHIQMKSVIHIQFKLNKIHIQIHNLEFRITEIRNSHSNEIWNLHTPICMNSEFNSTASLVKGFRLTWMNRHRWRLEVRRHL
jgi:hypothetical protein